MVLIKQKIAATCTSAQISHMSCERQKGKNHFYRPFPGPHWELWLVVRSLQWRSFTALENGSDHSETIFPILKAVKQQRPHWNLAFLRGGWLELHVAVGQSNAVTGTGTVDPILQFYSHARDESPKRKTEGQQWQCERVDTRYTANQDTHLLPEKQAVEVFASTEWVTFQINPISSRNINVKTLPSSSSYHGHSSLYLNNPTHSYGFRKQIFQMHPKVLSSSPLQEPQDWPGFS